MERLAGTRFRNRLGPEKFDDIQPNWALVALPTAISVFTFHYGAALVIVLITLGGFITDKHDNRRLSPTWRCAVLPAGALLIILRPNYPTAEIDVVFFLLVLIAISNAIYRSNSRAAAIISLHDGVGVLLIVSVALWFMGFNTGVAYNFGKNVITGGDRILFPITSTLAMAPTMAAAYIVALPMIMITTRRYQVFRVTALLAAACILVESDRRSALFAVVFVVVLMIPAPWIFRRIAPWIIGIALTSPILIAAFPALSALSGVLSGLVTPFQRTREDISTLNGRSGIWTKSLEFYQDRFDFLHQMFGYGTWGQVKSGASSAYTGIFAGLYRDRALKSPHSTLLQVLFDGGWITAISFTMVLYGAARMLATDSSRIDLAGLSMLTAMSFVGATENTLGPHLTAVPFWITAVIVTVAFSRERPAATVDGASTINITTNGDSTRGQRPGYS